MSNALIWLKTWTLVWVVLALLAVYILGHVLRIMVRSRSLHPTAAQTFIEFISVVAGGVIGSVVVLLILIILWPQAGNWVINVFLPQTSIWQTEFQQWITNKIGDPMTSSTIGLLIQRIQFGSAVVGFITGWFAKWLIEALMGKAFHIRAMRDRG